MRSDLDFLHVTPAAASNTWRFTVADHLARLDGKLYGGSAIAASIAAAEARAGRPILWMTTQFVATAGAQEEVEVGVEVLAEGRRAAQVRVTGTDASGDVLFASLGAAGHVDAEQPRGVFVEPPEVTPFEDSEPWGGPIATMTRLLGDRRSSPSDPPGVGFMSVVEFTEPEILHHPDDRPGRLAFWARRRDGGPMTAAVVAYVADLVPLSVSAALGVAAVGTSLDNTIRADPSVVVDQVLLDLRPQVSIGGCCYGEVHAWSPDGRLLATATQSAVLRPLDPSMFSMARS